MKTITRSLFMLIMLVLILATVAGAQYNPEPLFQYADKFTYWSDVSDGVYWWAVRNESTTVTLTSWTVGAGHIIGSAPDTILPEAKFPLPTVKSDIPRPWFNAFLNNSEAPVIVMGTLWWSDLTSTAVPTYVPQSMPMPEPSSLLVLSLLVGGIALKRRK